MLTFYDKIDVETLVKFVRLYGDLLLTDHTSL